MADEWPGATFRRIGDKWGVASDKKLKPGDVVHVTKANESVVEVEIGTFVREIKADRYAGGAPTYLYTTAVEDAKADEWPPRLTITPGGAVALWAKKNGLPATRPMIEELLECFGQTYDGVPIDGAPATEEDDTPF